MMKRDLHQLVDQTFDLLVIGAGIYGSFVAWDAALRGLSVGLIDKGDFGSATSANSLKTIHGGLRYLQDLNLALARNMVSERKAWVKVAPHLVHPLPFLMPTTPGLTRSKAALQIALRINDLIGYDRNHSIDPNRWMPAGHVLSKRDFMARVPGFESRDITGGAMWFDAQMYSSERLLLSVVLAAEQQGAVVSNYVHATSFLHNENAVRGARAQDVLTGQEFDIRARCVVNAAGPWIGSLLKTLNGFGAGLRFRPSIAINLVTRQLLAEFALGVPSRYSTTSVNGSQDRRSQMFFIVPWQGYSILGTFHAAYSGTPEGFQIDEDTIDGFLAEINTAYPAARLSRDDVYHIHVGLLPVAKGSRSSNSLRLLRESVVYDHQDKEGLSGLVSVIGVKYTTARMAAEKAVDLVFSKLGWDAPPCQTQETPIYGGQIDRLSDFIVQAVSHHRHGLDSEVAERLAYHYGSEYNQILGYPDVDSKLGQRITAEAGVIGAEVIHAMRAEMAQTLADVVLRRTGLGAAGPPSIACLNACAEILAGESGWDQARIDHEIETLLASYPFGMSGQVKVEPAV